MMREYTRTQAGTHASQGHNSGGKSTHLGRPPSSSATGTKQQQDSSAHEGTAAEGPEHSSHNKKGLRGCLHGVGARIVNIFRWNNDHGSAPVLLAIGDGANDVAMLQVC